MAHVERELEALALRLDALAFHPLRRSLLQRIELLVDALRRHRRGHDLGVLEDVQDVRRRGAERAPGGGGLPLRHDYLAYAELAREDARVRGPGAAEGEKHKVARVEAFLHRDLADDVGHLQLDDAAYAGGALDRAHADLRAERSDRVARRFALELHPAAREIVRIEIAEHELRVGHRGHAAAAPITDRTGKRAGTVRADGHGARFRLHANEAAATGADRLQVDLGEEVLVLIGVGDEGVGGLALEDDRHVERRAAHVGGDDVLLAHRVA